MRILLLALWLAGLGPSMALAAAPAAPLTLKPCRLVGVEHPALCGVVQRPLDPAQAQGQQIEIHVAVLPALARNKKPDPVFFFAGGPGQSAMDLAGPMGRLLARLSSRRDLVFIDQRGTGRSAPLRCKAESPTRPLAELVDPMRQWSDLSACRQQLEQLEHGKLRFYTTSIAMQDADAVRRALGAERINLVGGSYGTRAALEYLRQFPHAVRRVVLDGVAPPDMVLPASFSPDNQAALESLLAACEGDATCAARYPGLRSRWQALLASLPREASLPHPATRRDERLVLTRDVVLAMVRQALYVPVLASGLPLAIVEAADGRFLPLLGLSLALVQNRPALVLAQGMHLSVVCAEDAPRLEAGADAPGADFGNTFAAFYRRACADWPRGDVPAGFYQVPKSSAATLVLSGGIDPATPPRHGERVAKALGELARHVVVPHAAHGVMAIGCTRDLLYRFIDAPDAAAALALDAGCVQAIPRPPVFVPLTAEAAK